MRVMIIDYGMGNLYSVKRSFEKSGAGKYVEIVENPKLLKEASHIILPGVGTFKDGMHNLKERNWDYYIKEAVEEFKIPLLGICLGMQLLASIGSEIEETEGLNLIPGKVEKLIPKSSDERIPHVGWNEINITNDNCELFQGINNLTDYYFVHSYHFIPEDKELIICNTPYCGEFISGVAKNLVFGVQFHPEKSHTGGFKLIKNFLAI